MTRIKAIGFDFGGVVGGDPSLGHRFTEASAKLIGIAPEEWQKVYFSLNYLLNTGQASSKEVFWRQFLDHFGQTDKLSEQIRLDKTYASRYLVLNPQILALIDALRENGYKVGLLSNANQEVKRNIESLNVASHFDVFLFSADLKLQKPSPLAFQALAQALGVDLTELVFIDDAPKSLSSASELGFKPILFESFEQLTKDLLSLDISY